MNLYKCIKVPEKLINESNQFITYAFNITSSSSSYWDSNSYGYNNYDYNKPTLTLNKIYAVCSDYCAKEIIYDDYGRAFNVSDIMEYLEPYELVIDELSKKLMENKKSDNINIIPLFFNGVNDITYQVTISAVNKKGYRVYTQTYGTSIYECLLDAYKDLRQNNGYYRMFHDLIHNKAYPRIKYF